MECERRPKAATQVHGCRRTFRSFHTQPVILPVLGHNPNPRTMPKKFAALLLTGLILLVPMRTVASVTMVFYSGHPADISAEFPEIASASGLPGCPNGEQSFKPLPDSHHSHEPSGKYAGTACNAYGSCCGCASGLSAASLIVISDGSASFPVAFIDRPYIGFPPDSPERPPRPPFG